MVSNKFLAAVSVKLGFHKHLRFSGTTIEHQNREYVIEVEEAEIEAKGARDYWTNTKQPPKVQKLLLDLCINTYLRYKALSDVVESYIGAIFVDSEYDLTEVERFFDKHMRWFFEDMSIYDTFANNHPTVSPSLPPNPPCHTTHHPPDLPPQPHDPFLRLHRLPPHGQRAPSSRSGRSRNLSCGSNDP